MMSEELKLAVERGRTDVVKGFLSTLQENPSAENNLLLHQILKEPCLGGETLLHMSTRLGQADTTRALLHLEADPSIKDQEGRTGFGVAKAADVISAYQEILLQAAAQSKIDQVKRLVRAGVAVNFVDTDESRNTPLHWAASFANPETVEYLCRHGAKVNVTNTSGCTPLHDAVNRANSDIVNILLKYGSDPHMLITQGKYAGKDAYELAGDNEKLLTLLRNPPAPISPAPDVETDSELPTDQVPIANGPVNGVLTTTGPPAPTPQLMSPVFKSVPVFDDAAQPPKPVVTEEKLGLLWPQPQSIIQKDGKPFTIEKVLRVFLVPGPGIDAKSMFHPWRLQEYIFSAVGLELDLNLLTPMCDLEPTHVMCHVNKRLCPGQGSYKITITQKQLKVLCNDCDSLLHALATIVQLFQAYYEEDQIHIPQLLIDDWPVLPYRGVLLDISQGRVLNMVAVQETMRSLSLMKINQVHIFIRIKNVSSPSWEICYTKLELLYLDEFCQGHGIQLCPVIEVAPGVQFEDLAQLYPVFQDFLSCFNHNEFVSIGPRLSTFLLDVSEDNVLNVNDTSRLLPLRSDQTVQLCGYPLHDLEENLIQQLQPQLVFNEYGVQANHDFYGCCRPLSKHGISFFVCPGTAAWNSLAGCPEAAVTNIFNAVKCATTDGALGVLVCNWSGKGHVTHEPFCWSGFVIGAGLGWNSDCHWEYLLSNLGELLNQHVFRDDKHIVGQAVVELGRAETYLLRCARCQAGDDTADLPADQGSVLYQLLLHPDAVSLENLTPDILQRAMRHVKKCQTELKEANLLCPSGDQILAELQLTCDLMTLAVKVGRALMLSGKNPGGQPGLDIVNLGIANLSATAKTDLANRLLELLEVYKSLWNQRYLPSFGLVTSVQTINAVLKQFIPDKDTEELTATKDS